MYAKIKSFTVFDTPFTPLTGSHVCLNVLVLCAINISNTCYLNLYHSDKWFLLTVGRNCIMWVVAVVKPWSKSPR